jgi:outer membrane autotransporter protein
MHTYGIANLYYEAIGTTQTEVAGIDFTSKRDRLSAGLGLGASYSWNNEAYAVYGEGIATASLSSPGDTYTLRGKVGLRVKW